MSQVIEPIEEDEAGKPGVEKKEHSSDKKVAKRAVMLDVVTEEEFKRLGKSARKQFLKEMAAALVEELNVLERAYQIQKANFAGYRRNPIAAAVSDEARRKITDEEIQEDEEEIKYIRRQLASGPLSKSYFLK
jgi:hypothetical protein